MPIGSCHALGTAPTGSHLLTIAMSLLRRSISHKKSPFVSTCQEYTRLRIFLLVSTGTVEIVLALGNTHDGSTALYKRLDMITMQMKMNPYTHHGWMQATRTIHSANLPNAITSALALSRSKSTHRSGRAI